MTVADAAEATFTETFGRPPDAVWSAPGRVNLIGEHTDYNDGFVLPFALPMRIAVAVRSRTDGALRIATLRNGTVDHGDPLAIDDLAPGLVEGWLTYPAGVAWSLREAGVSVPGAEVLISSEVPTGAGLSSSAAVECAVALALLDVAGRPQDGPDGPSLPEIARWAQRAENDFAGAPTGVLDQTASLACTAAHGLFFDVRTGATEQIPFDTASEDLELLVVDTRASHSHSESGYRARREGCERAAELLGVNALRDVGVGELDRLDDRLPPDLLPLVRHVVTENDRVLRTVQVLRSEKIAEIGPLLSASHASLRDDYRVSSPELDVTVDAALAAGALGARMTGGGFGGSAIALVRTQDRSTVESAVDSAFAKHHFPSPRMFVGVPAAGAGRDR
ncbi:galactokinase [Allosaccharopolyspora coralli]|uniref:Galactokinase n=1 Tax=Allosaccharopolyspora coralli TaxID=2665642 RepID=A0A5Q3Q556_9PSEU|nr:galactokinase [Allosaccharopolyspora coralli]QGK69463.1 galactokinase [Allosaccharopolyspora coralli]